jgi:hypothetical protein
MEHAKLFLKNLAIATGVAAVLALGIGALIAAFYFILETFGEVTAFSIIAVLTIICLALGMTLDGEH